MVVCPACLPAPPPFTQGDVGDESDEDEGRRHNVNDKYVGVNVSTALGLAMGCEQQALHRFAICVRIP